MSFSIKDRQIFGLGAAACAVCCATPVLTAMGIAGAAATVGAALFAGVVFGIVVAAGAALTLLAARSRRTTECSSTADTPAGPVDVTVKLKTPGRPA